jgi:dTDP-4-dehydrorhamnose reductase
MRVLVLGAGGMLGHTLHRLLAAMPGFEVHGTLRRPLPPEAARRTRGALHSGVDALDTASVAAAIDTAAPAVLINCVGLIKQLEQAHDPLAAIALNAMLPHRLAQLCTARGIRLIHISTDCVFTGAQGHYPETAISDADDLYGRTKRLGEVSHGGHLTLRTSIIGHALQHGVSLIDWFLAQRGEVAGYANAVFSGLPTVEVARVLGRFVLPRADLAGLYHLGAAPIDKDSLLRLVARQYRHDIAIRRQEEPRLDRSLDSRRLRAAIGYEPQPWPDLVAAMHADHLPLMAPARHSGGTAA